MIWLILGLIVFFSNHSVRIINDEFRTRFIEEKGKLAWRGLYSMMSLLGLGLIIYGFGETRADPVFLWNPPLWTRHAAAFLVFIAFCYWLPDKYRVTTSNKNWDTRCLQAPKYGPLLT